MRYKQEWDKAKEKYLEYWERENHDRPLIAVTAPRDGAKAVEMKAPGTLRERWMDVEYLLKSHRAACEATYFGGEALPVFNPNLGPDIFGAILGCELEFGKDTSWSTHFVQDLEVFKTPPLSPDNKWWHKIKEITGAAVEDAKGDYLVGITDLHPGLDGIVALRGPENACMDLLDCPEAVKRINFELLEIFKQVTDELYNMVSSRQEGSICWMHAWHPGKWYVTSCDFICMISPAMFDEFILPELNEEINWLDASLFHLDGPGALKHLDRLLEIPGLKGIQWVPGAGKPAMPEWIPVLRKIQKAGKLLHLSINPEDLIPLMEEVDCEGVLYHTCCRTEQEAKDLLRMAENYHSIRRR